jgi:baseplate J-like protein
MIYDCCNEKRKAAVSGNPALNGIDYLEVPDASDLAVVASALRPPPQCILLIHCLNPLPPTLSLGPAPTSGGPLPSGGVNVVIDGGESIPTVAVDWVIAAAQISATTLPPAVGAIAPLVSTLADKPNVLLVRTHQAGDFSTYCLRLVNDATKATGPFAITDVLTGFDPQLAAVDFSFKVESGPDFDCARTVPDCPPAGLTPPAINYLAKDYGSFRTIILDRLNQLLPSWGGSSEADLGVALAELMAYLGDHLSYQQDAVATEAYLETARRRVSLRRHALLVDYQVQEGCNARAFVHLDLNTPAGTPVFLDRTRVRFNAFTPGMPSSLAPGLGNGDNEEAAIRLGVPVFEPMHDAVLYADHNELHFHTWGDTDCCLPKGATEATLRSSYPLLQIGDVLIFQEMIGPQTGNPADADIRRRCAVRLTNIATQDSNKNPLVDPLDKDAAGNPIQVTEIQWAQADALPFPLCISSTYLDSAGDQQSVSDVSVAFGNIVLADHGVSLSGKLLGTVPPPRLYYPPDPAADRCQLPSPSPVPARYRPTVPDKPLTQVVALATVPLTGAGNPATSAPVSLSNAGPVPLPGKNGFASLTLRPTDPTGWPQYFGVVVNANATTPGNIDLTVVYNPPGGAAGVLAQVPVEKFTNLSLRSTGTNYVATAINTGSKLIAVPTTYVAPTGALAGFAAAPTMLANAGTIDLYDLGNPPNKFLTLQPPNPALWPPLFAVTAQANAQDATRFDLTVLYDPKSGGMGATLPVTVEHFADLLLTDVDSQIAAASALVISEDFAQGAALILSAQDLIQTDPRLSAPAITLTATSNDATTTWIAEPNLLESGDSDPVFAVEVESDGTASLLFGDDVNGETPDAGTVFTASYRIGNGTAGNVGADSLIYFSAADPVVQSQIQSCRNPLPAIGGTDPETTDQIRRRAPQAFLTQERAVTMADYETLTELNPQVDRAAASLRWTGAWYTASVAIEPTGGGNPSPTLSSSLRQELERYRMAGQDLAVESPEYISLELALAIGVDPDYFRADVEQALLAVLSNRRQPDGSTGLFYPDNFVFGQTVYLSPIYAAARSVAGVISVEATAFQPLGVATQQYLDAGELKLGALQVARLDNDPNFPSHGQLTLAMQGGR